MLPCKRVINSKHSAKFLKMAEGMARSLRGGYAVKQRVIDGCLVEGKKAGNLLSASSLELDSSAIALGEMDPRTESIGLSFGGVASLSAITPPEVINPSSMAIPGHLDVVGSPPPMVGDALGGVRNAYGQSVSHNGIIIDARIVSEPGGTFNIENPTPSGSRDDVSYVVVTAYDTDPVLSKRGFSISAEELSKASNGYYVRAGYYFTSQNSHVLGSASDTTVFAAVIMVKYGFPDPGDGLSGVNPYTRWGLMLLRTDPDKRSPVLKTWISARDLPWYMQPGVQDVTHGTMSLIIRDAKAFPDGSFRVILQAVTEVPDGHIDNSVGGPYKLWTSAYALAVIVMRPNGSYYFEKQFTDLIGKSPNNVHLYSSDAAVYRYIDSAFFVGDRCFYSAITAERRYSADIYDYISGPEDHRSIPPFTEFYLDGVMIGTEASFGAGSKLKHGFSVPLSIGITGIQPGSISAIVGENTMAQATWGDAVDGRTKHGILFTDGSRKYFEPVRDLLILSMSCPQVEVRSEDGKLLQSPIILVYGVLASTGEQALFIRQGVIDKRDATRDPITGEEGVMAVEWVRVEAPSSAYSFDYGNEPGNRDAWNNVSLDPYFVGNNLGLGRHGHVLE